MLVPSASAAAHVLFQDGAQSIPCPGGTLWLFGDTFLGEPDPTDSSTPPSKESHPHFDGAAGATLAFLPAGHTDLTYLTGPNSKAADPLSLFPGESPDQLRMWPLGGITVGGRIYVYYAMIQKTSDPSPWNFRDTGGGPPPPTSRSRPSAASPQNDNWRFPRRAASRSSPKATCTLPLPSPRRATPQRPLPRPRPAVPLSSSPLHRIRVLHRPIRPRRRPAPP